MGVIVPGGFVALVTMSAVEKGLDIGLGRSASAREGASEIGKVHGGVGFHRRGSRRSGISSVHVGNVYPSVSIFLLGGWRAASGAPVGVDRIQKAKQKQGANQQIKGDRIGDVSAATETVWGWM